MPAALEAEASTHEEVAGLALPLEKGSKEVLAGLHAELRDARSQADHQSRQLGHEIGELHRELVDLQRRGVKVCGWLLLHVHDVLWKHRTASLRFTHCLAIKCANAQCAASSLVPGP